ncbi:unnamed protein product [Coregonus sp. 'balchen']|nr:unnamed protein product [Coregonus sp. 'balchen']
MLTQMAYRRGQGRAAWSQPQRRGQEYSDLQDTYLLHGEPSPPLSDLSLHASWWTGRDEHNEIGEQLSERYQHVARLQDALRREREKGSSLQSRCSQQGSELRRKEQHSARLKERLSQLTERHRERGACKDVCLTLSHLMKEEAALRVMLERREAELREAMKLRHKLTTLLHALRADMERTLLDTVGDQEEDPNDDKMLVQSEESLGDHVTGGVVHGWKGHVAVGTDQDKLLAQLETELDQSQQLVKLQQHLLQDSVITPVPAALTDCYFLEEWERLQDRWAELELQKRSFQRERRAFTDAAIRLGHERCEFEQQRACVVKQQYLFDCPLWKTLQHLSGSDHMILSGCRPATPSSAESGFMPWSSESDAQSECLDVGAERLQFAPPGPRLDWSFQ